jgi:hypothetical protein
MDFLKKESAEPRNNIKEEDIGKKIKDIEEKISCKAYSIVKLLKKNIPVGLRINDRLYEPDISYGHKIRMLKDLALYNIQTARQDSPDFKSATG